MNGRWENGYIVRALNQLASLIHEAKSPDPSSEAKSATSAAEHESNGAKKSSGRRKTRTIAKLLILVASVAILRKLA